MITGNFKASYFCRILDKFTGRAKPIRDIGDPDKQCPDKWSSTVHIFVSLIHLLPQFVPIWTLLSRRDSCVVLVTLFGNQPTDFDKPLY